MDSTDTLFITGATGQLGAFVLAELLGRLSTEGFEGSILCARRASSSMAQVHMVEDFLELERGTLAMASNVKWMNCDLSDAHHTKNAIDEYCAKANLPQPSTIIHAAATINISPSASKETSNEQLTDEMLKLAEMLGVKHFTHISSIAVMGGTVALGEEEVIGPEHFHPNRSDAFLSNYALGKIASELRVWAAHAAGLSISIIRPGVILGMGPKANAPQELWARILDGKLPLTTDGSTGVVDVRDVASMILKAHTQKVEGPLVAVAENVPFYELVDGMSSAIGVRKNIKRLNANPWLERMRFLGFLSHIPLVGRFFTPQMRIMLFSRVKYDGASGGAVHPYRSLDQTLNDFGTFLQKAWK